MGKDVLFAHVGTMGYKFKKKIFLMDPCLTLLTFQFSTYSRAKCDKQNSDSMREKRENAYNLGENREPTLNRHKAEKQ